LTREKRGEAVSDLITYALTIREPNAWAIFDSPVLKDIELRGWRTHIRGTIAIHASAFVERVFESERRIMLRRHRDLGLRVPLACELDHGAIIGVVDVIDCVSAQSSSSPWRERGYKWAFVLANPRRLSRVIHCRGGQRFWRLLPSSAKDIKQQLDSGANMLDPRHR
jgi:hypothetical protein